ncbi:MAG: HD domain-containing protein, partial [Actinomycetota bacterium]|nr:HD domain-containing protein [Actinomycetota bacterium]
MLVDQRMYAQKTSARASAGRQTTDVLLRVLAERSPALGDDLDDVTDLCRRVGEALALPDEEMVPLLQAAALRDVGNAAIPDALLAKAGPSDEAERSFMRRHTLIGERILGGAPALAKAALLVRSSHERIDGGGYPDGLLGDAIPLGARVIAACDAYHAMVSDRPYRAGSSPDAAMAELTACAGTQFDPRVVAAVCAVLAPARTTLATPA